ncbi:unnamed protein product [Albugo candida]|uniref:Uncharacterized protein n=1 Tax=Albugo candida TaxID=65357 RepID=A0A024GBE0_9STRA|nr:unnamed protein product [Albugo candida]|eukprot:CCI44083.1 unnamed protein product [Albugo candida]
MIYHNVENQHRHDRKKKSIESPLTHLVLLILGPLLLTISVGTYGTEAEKMFHLSSQKRSSLRFFRPVRVFFCFYLLQFDVAFLLHVISLGALISLNVDIMITHFHHATRMTLTSDFVVFS